MYTKPELFKGYIAASPAVGLDDDWLIRRARDWAKSGKPINARLYVTGAEFEWPKFLAAIKRYQAALPPPPGAKPAARFHRNKQTRFYHPPPPAHPHPGRCENCRT
jgi:hypothetical protein